jgi:hypothetical protein
MNALALFGTSILASFVSSTGATQLFVWPRLQKADPNRALTLLVAPHMFFRLFGLSFLVPGVVSPLLPAGFAMPAAYGDFIAGVLAIVATIALVTAQRGPPGAYGCSTCGALQTSYSLSIRADRSAFNRECSERHSLL